MSLPALALLMTAAGALRDVAPDWMQVEISPHEPIALAEAEKKAIVALYRGDEVHTLERRSWFNSPRTVELAVQVLLPPIIRVTFEGASVEVKTHGPGGDMLFAAVHRYLEMAFAAPAPGTWGELFQDFITKHDGDLEGRPFLVMAGKVQVVALDYSLPCRTLPSPPLGSAPAAFWPQFVAKMRTTPSFAGAADFVEALIKGVPLPLWRAEQVLAGLSRREGNALGLGLVAPLTDTPNLGAVVIESPVGTTRVEVVP